MSVLIEKLVVVGVGLIGGSFAAALKAAGAVRQVVGVDRDEANAAAAIRHGIVDAVGRLDKTTLADAAFVLLAVPVGQIEWVMQEMAPHLSARCIVTDAGSTKCNVEAAARRHLPTRLLHFVPGHPIAGAETSGVEAANPALYQGRSVVLTPLVENAPEAVECVANVWRACGAQVEQLTPETHDRIFAAVSHLPHLLSFALVDDLSQRVNAEQLFDYAASGFRDFTRIAASHPEMWRDICLANREALLGELNAYRNELDHLHGLLSRADGAALEAVFAHASAARKAWAANQTS